MVLDVGKHAPQIETLDQSGNRVRPNLKGKTVLYFYPKDDTPGCTKEACAFRDDLTEFQKLGVKVYGVSTDDAESHRKFVEKYGLNFTLLADPDKKIARQYGVLSEKGYASRVTYLIENETIKHVWPQVNPEGHSREVLEKLKQL